MHKYIYIYIYHPLLVEPHLAAGEASNQDVDSSCYEAIIAHVVVQVIDPLRGVCAGGGGGITILHIDTKLNMSNKCT